LVAIFTYHDPIGEKGGRTDFQTQAIAYSLDHGQTWTKYDKNPVLQNPGIRDFRDPKLSWYEPGKKWIMTLATLDRISFFSSTDLKHWKKESEFGKTYGGHGGVWECPDLFPMSVGGKNMWVLLVSINPGGPNKGSATQYFIGQFDGKSFTSTQKDTRWIDYGPDDYAGVTWSNTGNRRIFLGWMGNWIYAMEVPTQPWRSAMTLPRELSLSKLGNDYFLVSRLAAETGKLKGLPVKMADLDGSNLDISGNTGVSANAGWVKLSADAIKSYAVVLSNDQGEEVEIGYDAAQNNYYIDRSKSGIVNFKEGFSGRFTAPRISKNLHMDIELVMDKASVEVFADGGVSVMTGIYFPHQEFTHIRLKSTGKLKVALLQAAKMHSAW
jgi:fructan beta-fructosidase